jgi:heme exporter protein B
MRMKLIQQIQAIVWKDLTSELRSKEVILSMCLFSFLVLIIFNFAFETGFVKIKGMTPGILWVAFIFSALMGLHRAFGVEKDRGTLPGLLLCPVSPWGIYLAKMLATFIFTAIMEIFALAIFVILYNLDVWPYLAPLGLIIFLGTLGFTVVGTLFSAISASTRAREKILSILVFPISIPIIIAAVKATGMILDGKTVADVYAWLKILIAFDLVFLLLAYLTFGFVNVPLTFMAIRLWRTIHPVIITPKGMNMSAPMKYTLILSLCAFGFLFFSLLISRVKLEKMRMKIEGLRDRIENEWVYGPQHN